MKKESTSTRSLTDWDRLRSMRDEDIDLSEIPEITDEQMATADLRIGGKLAPEGKVPVGLFLDVGIVEFFKARAGEAGFRELINETLKSTIRE